jgi:hypothetical protein
VVDEPDPIVTASSSERRDMRMGSDGIAWLWGADVVDRTAVARLAPA